MSRGMRRRWERGERTTSVSKNGKGQEVTLLGKNGGPVVKQLVTLVMEPKAVRS